MVEKKIDFHYVSPPVKKEKKERENTMPRQQQDMMKSMPREEKKENSMDASCIDKLPLAMAYVPMQRWENIYDGDVGFERGTIFKDLDLPFLGEELS